MSIQFGEFIAMSVVNIIRKLSQKKILTKADIILLLLAAYITSD